MKTGGSRMLLLRTLVAVSVAIALFITTPRTPGVLAATPGLTATEIVLGGTNAITGVVAAACIGVQYGAEATFQAVNRAGGVYGRKISYTALDDAYSPQRALANARRQIESNDAFALFGGCGTATASTVLAYAVETKVPYLFPYAGLDALVMPLKPTVFALLPLYSDQMKAITPYAIAKFKAKTIAIVTSNIPGNKEWTAAIRAVAERAGVKEVYYKAYELGTPDVAPMVLELKQANPELFALTTSAPDGGRWMQEMARQNWFPKAIVGISTFTDQVFIQAAGDLANGRVIAPGFSVTPTDPRAKACNDELRAYKPDFKPSHFTLYGCLTAKVTVEVFRRAGKDLTRESLYAALNQMKEFDTGFTPPVTFDAANHMGLRAIIPVGVVKGDFVVLGAPIEY
jgi:branched-chain amino acid transport system substrate-binding protein